MRYTHLFFDLDHTLWDFESNSRAVFHELFRLRLEPYDPQMSVHRAQDRYESINADLWSDLRRGAITKADVRRLRFELLLQEVLPHVESDRRRIVSELLEVEFVQQTPQQKRLMPGAAEAVQRLHGRYSLHIITNGFPESQYTKLKYSGLEKYFDSMTTSEEVGAYKPAGAIFEAALQTAGADSTRSLVLGDGWEADILGAAAAGMDQVFYNPGRTVLPAGHRPTAVIHHWDELDRILPQ